MNRHSETRREIKSSIHTIRTYFDNETLNDAEVLAVLSGSSLSAGLALAKQGQSASRLAVILGALINPRTPSMNRKDEFAYLDALILTVAAVSLLVVHASVFPPFRAPDEAAHVDRVLQLAETPTDAFSSLRLLGEDVLAAEVATGFTGPPSELPPLGLRPAQADKPFAELERLPNPPELRNQMTQHPPTYYAIVGLVLRGWQSNPNTLLSDVMLLRLLSGLGVVVLPSLAYVTCQRLGGARKECLLSGIACLSVPMLYHIGGAVNNDAWLSASFSIVVLQAVERLRSRHSPLWARGTCWTGTIAATMWLKGFGLAVVPFVLLAEIIRVRRHGVDVGGLVATILGVGGGAAWRLRNLVVEGTLQPTHASLPVASAGFSPDWSWWVPFGIDRVVGRFWVEPDVAQDFFLGEPVAGILLTVALGAGSFVMWRCKKRSEMLLLLLPTMGCVAIMVYGAATYYAETGAPFGLHGRYVYPGLTVLSALAGRSVALVAERYRQSTLDLCLLLALGYQLVVAYAALTFYWGVERRGPILGAVEALRGWVPMSLWLHVSVVVFASVSLLWWRAMTQDSGTVRVELPS